MNGVVSIPPNLSSSEGGKLDRAPAVNPQGRNGVSLPIPGFRTARVAGGRRPEAAAPSEANRPRRAKPIPGAERSQSGPPRCRANPGVQEGRPSFGNVRPVGPAPAPSEANPRRRAKPTPRGEPPSEPGRARTAGCCSRLFTRGLLGPGGRPNCQGLYEYHRKSAPPRSPIPAAGGRAGHRAEAAVLGGPGDRGPGALTGTTGDLSRIERGTRLNGGPERGRPGSWP